MVTKVSYKINSLDFFHIKQIKKNCAILKGTAVVNDIQNGFILYLSPLDNGE